MTLKLQGAKCFVGGWGGQKNAMTFFEGEGGGNDEGVL
jgi:hypothetical protein